jgi:hypothetical protein
MTNKPKPRPGDVILVNSPNIETRMSRLWQIRDSPRTFGHVAITISELLAIEAVPADPKDMIGKVPQLPQTAKFGDWSGVELRAGVRLIPIADLIIPAIRRSAEYVALRKLDADEKILSRLTAHHEDVLNMLGSQYSIDVLINNAARILPKSVIERVGPKINWSSIPIDLVSHFSAEMRQSIATHFLDFVIPDVARTYFCSQLVIECLGLVELLSSNDTTTITTPSALYGKLHDRGWADVSDIYFCDPETELYLNQTKSDCKVRYLGILADVSSKIWIEANKIGVKSLEAHFKATNKMLDDMTSKLERIIKGDTTLSVHNEKDRSSPP